MRLEKRLGGEYQAVEGRGDILHTGTREECVYWIVRALNVQIEDLTTARDERIADGCRWEGVDYAEFERRYNKYFLGKADLERKKEAQQIVSAKRHEAEALAYVTGEEIWAYSNGEVAAANGGKACLLTAQGHRVVFVAKP